MIFHNTVNPWLRAFLFQAGPHRTQWNDRIMPKYSDQIIEMGEDSHNLNYTKQHFSKKFGQAIESIEREIHNNQI